MVSFSLLNGFVLGGLEWTGIDWNGHLLYILGISWNFRGTFVELLHLIIKELEENLELAWNFRGKKYLSWNFRGTFTSDNQGVTTKFGTCVEL